jgi:Fis family transcriptional regulator|tara:strand:+ start:746 stop:1066 length:321 start_codon:yes stop_codon:yes gene_type:complete
MSDHIKKTMDSMPSTTSQTIAPGYATNPQQVPQSLRQSVAQSLTQYFNELDGQQPNALYDLFMQQVEAPLFECVMEHTQDNQSKAAALLGLNRGTLRKKLKQYDLL